MALAGVDTTALEDEAFDMEVSQDKCIIRLISSCCSSKSIIYVLIHTRVNSKSKNIIVQIHYNRALYFLSGDNFVRASELMQLLTLEKSMTAAITLVTKLKLPFLAEKFSSILEVLLVLYKNFYFLYIFHKREKLLYFFIMLTSDSSLTGKVA